MDEGGSVFRSLSCQQLCGLRLLIEKGRNDEFIEKIRENPRALLASGDTPNPAHEGFRYLAFFNLNSMIRFYLIFNDHAKAHQVYIKRKGPDLVENCFEILLQRS